MGSEWSELYKEVEGENVNDVQGVTPPPGIDMLYLAS